MGGEGVTDYLLQPANVLPINGAVEGIPWIEIQHVRDSALWCRAEGAAVLHDPLLVMEEARVQAAADKAVTANRKCLRHIRGKRDCICGLQDISFIAENGF